ncbi:hypothetical protein LEP1GSC040_1290 [Leptospira santarosai str. 2000030832]|nr:hypothetical protein LEP1GSC040_1290 [Leptospira santarosai str. 2000030832]
MLRGIFIKSEDRGFKIKFPYEIAVLRPNQTMRNSFYRVPYNIEFNLLSHFEMVFRLEMFVENEGSVINL